MKKTFISSNLISVFLVLFTVIGPQCIYSQKKNKKSKRHKKEQVVTNKNKKIKTIKELTKKSEKLEGLFTVYRDTTTGKTKILIREEQIGKEYIYFSQVRDGVLDAGMFRGAYGRSKVFKIVKYFDKIEFVTQNHSFYYDPSSELSKSSDANISEGIMASLKIEAKDSIKGTFLINSDELFLKETFSQIKRPRNPKSSPLAFKLGKLSREKTKVSTIKNYPENTFVVSNYVYSSPSVLNGGSSAVTDGRNVTIKIDHQLIEMPKNNYVPRFDDPRVGYFLTTVNDMTTASPTPYKDLIHRWNLVKKDSSKALSEPIKPIVWWIENSTPKEFRPTIKEAVLEWNKAFEQAGFKDAIVVKTQSDTASWDAGDIRYNVLRWTSSPRPPFGGYGPSFVNPRTGEILGADIMLEYIYHTNRVKYDRLFSMGQTEVAQENFNANFIDDTSLYCSFGEVMHENSLFGHTALKVVGASDNEMKGMRLEAMKELIMHEVGHTLGLNHNMKASQLFTPAQLNDPEFIKGKCLTGSVMDYTAINVANNKENQGQYFSTAVGPYDQWAIEYGYTPVTSGDELLKIANKSTDPKLTFGNDADDMRYPGKAIDPRVMIGDMSNDQITYSINRINLVHKMLPEIKEKYETKDQSYQELRQAFTILNRQYSRAADVISRFVGGVYVDRSMIGQDAAKKPYTPVAYKDQKRAMKALEKYVFSPKAYHTPNKLYNYLAMQRRGFNFYNKPEDPKIHELVLSNQKRVLAHILHPNTLQRISDSELYGNKYKLSEFMTDLNNAIFRVDIFGSANTFRQNLQLAYTKKLIGIVSHQKRSGVRNRSNNSVDYSSMAKSMALYNLKKIKYMTVNTTGNKLTNAHRQYLKTIIENTLDELK